MKKFLLICLLFNFILGISQEKKISFEKEINYKIVDKNKTDVFLKTYASNTGEFLTKVNIKDFPMYFFTDALGTSAVGLEMNNRLDGSNALFASMFGVGNYGYNDAKEEYVLESKKLSTKETILGVPCSHYLINFKLKDDERKDKDAFKVCIDEKSSYNNLPVLKGLIKFFDRKTGFKNSDFKGFILKGGPEKSYDKDYFVATSMKDSKEFVHFDHKKAMVEQQRKQDSIAIAYKKEEEEYAKMDSVYAAADSAAVVADSTYSPSMVPYGEEVYYIPDYVSEYKNNNSEDRSLAIANLPNETLWKGLPKHCKNLEKDIPAFNNKELKGHLRNYVGQVCDMYLTQTTNHTVGIKITLDEIRREALYLSEIQDKLDASDKKKLNTYLKNLD